MFNVLYASDNNYAIYMLVSIYSLLKNNKDININVHIINDNISKEMLDKLESIFKEFPNSNLILINSDKIIDKINSLNIPKWRHTSISNSRLFFNEVIDREKLLYLDSDTIVVGSLKELNNIPNNSVYAVHDLISSTHYKKLDESIETYYNSGVLLLNRSEWENHNCPDKILDTINRGYEDLKYPDQDILNVALNGEIEKMDIKYNLFSPLKSFSGSDLKAFIKNQKIKNYYDLNSVEEAKNNPAILHCINYFGVRPWDNEMHPYALEYYKYLSELFPEVRELDKINLPKKLIFDLICKLKIYTPVKLKDSIKKMI